VKLMVCALAWVGDAPPPQPLIISSAAPAQAQNNWREVRMCMAALLAGLWLAGLRLACGLKWLSFGSVAVQLPMNFTSSK
jgi:hypothetical protein